MDVNKNKIVVTTDTGKIPFPYKCRDQVYGTAFLNLFAEPLVLGVPQVASDAFFSVMLTDQYAHNFAYIGSITTGNDAANYLIAGPNWKGTVPASIQKAFVSEGNFVTMILRLEVKNPEDPIDVDQTANVLKSCTLDPLSTFTGDTKPPEVDTPNLPPYPRDEALITPSIFTYVNAFSAALKIHPTEETLYQRFAKIGVYPGAPFPPVWMQDSVYEAISQGIWEGNQEVESELARQSVVNKIGGWLYICGIKPPLIGNRELMDGRYLARAGMARSTFEWGNDIQQAIYMQSFEDIHSKPLSGGNKYEVLWKESDQPPVKAFWSITMYDENGFYVDNAINRNNISSNTAGLKYDTRNNSLTIYIQDSDPGKSSRNNWLPCPSKGGFQVFLRCYWPKDIFFLGTYSPPLPRVVQ